MQAPNNSGTVSYSAGPSSIPGTPNHSTTGIGSSSAGDAPITNERSELMSKITKKQVDINYFQHKVIRARWEFNQLLHQRAMYQATGNLEVWKEKQDWLASELKDSQTNLASEIKIQGILRTKLANGDYSMPDTSVTTKRKFDDSSMDN